ncbi:protein-glutamine glutaminase family protein [Legionella fallonii]|uniref:Protein glutaminase domain-containing protein n=1 Tax=Legionella fallonii LLAP-10 TaxID=1212491 RepID=A0A098G520_9GAMM|nr:protein-glutamine glutaminase family protein [Legionella fallonii]CEG57089.1 conserved exported protein of unknown function [Legionella fallonii LLAP-10]
MKKLVFNLILIGLFAFCSTSYSVISQKRFPNETFQQALNRIKEHNEKNKKRTFYLKDTPERTKVPISQIDFSSAPEVSTHEELLRMFYLIRDSRFLYLEDNPDFSRRISWLFPDDGCFARAALAGMKLNENQLIRPAKIFTFGNLAVQTPYSSEGAVYWWYHVAEIVRYMDSYYVLDPALDSHEPLLVDDWFHMMGKDPDLEGVVCNVYTYGPFDDCLKATTDSDKSAQSDQLVYLQYEWERMGELGFDPVLVLGENPPWL